MPSVDIMYLLKSCEACSDLFFLPYNDKLTQEVDSKNLRIRFIIFERKYEELSDFTLM